LALLRRTVAAWGSHAADRVPADLAVLTVVQDRDAGDRVPPQLFFTPTLESFAEVQLRSDYLLYAATR
jgi:sorbitol/mannitol transport system permease protein